MVGWLVSEVLFFPSNLPESQFSVLWDRLLFLSYLLRCSKVVLGSVLKDVLREKNPFRIMAPERVFSFSS